MKMRRVVVSLLAVALAAAACSPGVQEPPSSPLPPAQEEGAQEEEEAEGPRPNEAIPIRGLVAVGDQVQEARELTSLGANFVEVVVWGQVLDNGTIISTPDSTAGPEAWSEERLFEDHARVVEIVGERIDKFRRGGLEVYLVFYPERFNRPHAGPYIGEYNVSYLLSQLTEIALEWARMAEARGAKLFSPANEIFLFVGSEEAIQWHADILLRLRGVYSGWLAPRGLQAYYLDWEKKQPREGEGLDFNFTGWDFVAFDIYGNGADTFEQVRDYIETTVTKAVELKEAHGARGVIFGEIGYPHSGREALLANHSLEALKSETWRIFLEESVGKVDGFFFWDWKEGEAFIRVENPDRMMRREYVGKGPKNVIMSFYLSET